jgi:predicted small lipoprotein YifL
MRVVFRMSAIVAALAVIGGTALGGCGQRGPLYLPTVPPLPHKPTDQTEPPPSDVRPDAETASRPASSATGAMGNSVPGSMAGSMPDKSGTPLSLSPDSELGSSPNASPSPPAPRPASGAFPNQ